MFTFWPPRQAHSVSSPIKSMCSILTFMGWVVNSNPGTTKYFHIFFISQPPVYELCPRPVLDQCIIITGRRKMTEKLLSPTKIAPNLRFSSNLKHFGFKESRHTRLSADNNLKRKIVLFLIYVVVTQKNRLVETVLLRPNNI